MVLHGVGGHERNLPTNELAKQYAAAIASAVASPGAGQRVERMRGPSRLQLGPTRVTTLGFGSQVSGVPLQRTIQHRRPGAWDHRRGGLRRDGARGRADARGRAQLHRRRELRATQSRLDEGLLGHQRPSPEEEFEVGMAHSSELQFEHGSDISDGGITALVFRKQKSTHALITLRFEQRGRRPQAAGHRRAQEGERGPDRAVHLGHPQLGREVPDQAAAITPWGRTPTETRSRRDHQEAGEARGRQALARRGDHDHLAADAAAHRRQIDRRLRHPDEGDAQLHQGLRERRALRRRCVICSLALFL